MAYHAGDQRSCYFTKALRLSTASAQVASRIPVLRAVLYVTVAVTLVGCAASQARAGDAAEQFPPDCGEGRHFDCVPISQGVAPPPGGGPRVCTCVPDSCPAGTQVVVDAGEGRWPDGTQRGRAGCGPPCCPSAAPPP